MYIPECKGNEQRGRATIHQTPTNLHVKSSAYSPADANELNMATLKLSVRLVAGLSYRSHDTRTTRMSALKCGRLLLIDTGTFDFILCEVVARRRHGWTNNRLCCCVFGEFQSIVFSRSAKNCTANSMYTPRNRDEGMGKGLYAAFFGS
jgi:hypothetical protein